jgi:hypothetical protein
MMFAQFKILGGLMCFLANCLIMLRSETIEDVIKDFIAVEIISNVDNLMAYTVTGQDVIKNMTVFLTTERAEKSDGLLIEDYIFDVMPVVEKDYLKPSGVKSVKKSAKKLATTVVKEEQVEEAMADGNYEERFSCRQKCYYSQGLICYRFFAVIYTGIYYYFAPFTVTILIIYSQVIMGRFGQENSSSE